MKLDKWLHMMTCMVITIIVSFWLSWVAGVFIALDTGLLKELYDKFNHKPFSMDDLYADAGGVLLGSAVFIIVGKILGM